MPCAKELLLQTPSRGLRVASAKICKSSLESSLTLASPSERGKLHKVTELGCSELVLLVSVLVQVRTFLAVTHTHSQDSAY